MHSPGDDYTYWADAIDAKLKELTDFFGTVEFHTLPMWRRKRLSRLAVSFTVACAALRSVSDVLEDCKSERTEHRSDC
jgi:hypothetical protein